MLDSFANGVIVFMIIVFAGGLAAHAIFEWQRAKWLTHIENSGKADTVAGVLLKSALIDVAQEEINAVFNREMKSVIYHISLQKRKQRVARRQPLRKRQGRA